MPRKILSGGREKMAEQGQIPHSPFWGALWGVVVLPLSFLVPTYILSARSYKELKKKCPLDINKLSAGPRLEKGKLKGRANLL